MIHQGIKPWSKYTRSYRGCLVKDYGFHALLKDFRSRFPNLTIDSDLPVRVDEYQIEHGLKNRVFMTAEHPKYPGQRYIYECFFQPADDRWYFFDNSGEYVDINKELRAMNKYKKYSDRWK